MRKYIIFYLFVLICLLLFFYSNKKNYNYVVNEEATPIRDLDEIKGMLYRIDIDDNNRDNIEVYSKILASIYHYKDISNINSFYIDLDVDDDYKINSINIVDDNNIIIRNIDYDNDNGDIIFNLYRDDFINYNSNYDIKIELIKNTRKI